MKSLITRGQPKMTDEELKVCSNIIEKRNSILEAYHNRANLKIFDTDTNKWAFAKTMDNYFGIPIEDFLEKYADNLADIKIYYGSYEIAKCSGCIRERPSLKDCSYCEM